MMKSEKISFVIPCYRSVNTIHAVIDEIEETMEKLGYDFEIILVNDASPDNTYEVLKEIAEKDARVVCASLAKNFGQHGALMAGYHFVTGDVVCCLDDDGQTPANEVGKLIEKIEEGYDLVYARYGNKKHSAFRNFGTWLNIKMTEIMLGKPRELFISSYFAARRYVIEEMKEYTHSYPYVAGLALRTTNKTTDVMVNHRAREIGESGYTFIKLVSLWMNGFTAFSVKPLRMATIVGTITAIAGFVYMIYTIVNKIMNPEVLDGWSSTISIILFIGGLILLVLGIIGEYIGRIYISLNKAPQYVIRESYSQNPDNCLEADRKSL